MMAVALVASYLLGSFPSAFLLVRRLKQVDIRSRGSGNVGATNTARVAGTRAGITVLILDGLKGALAVTWLASWLLADPTPAARLGCGLAAVIGHDFPVVLRFRGGKGVATTIGVLLGAMPDLATIALLVWLAVFLACRYVSAGSLAFAAAVPLLQLAAHQPVPQVLAGTALALLLIARHRSNIARLLQGTEERFPRRREG